MNEIFLKIDVYEDLIQIPNGIQGCCSLYVGVCAAPKGYASPDHPPNWSCWRMLQAAAHSPHHLQPHLSCGLCVKAALTCKDNSAQLVYLPILVPHWRMPGPYATLMESFSCFLHMSGLLEVFFFWQCCSQSSLCKEADSSSGYCTPTTPLHLTWCTPTSMECMDVPSWERCATFACSR